MTFLKEEPMGFSLRLSLDMILTNLRTKGDVTLQREPFLPVTSYLEGRHRTNESNFKLRGQVGGGRCFQSALSSIAPLPQGFRHLIELRGPHTAQALP